MARRLLPILFRVTLTNVCPLGARWPPQSLTSRQKTLLLLSLLSAGVLRVSVGVVVGPGVVVPGVGVIGLLQGGGVLQLLGSGGLLYGSGVLLVGPVSLAGVLVVPRGVGVSPRVAVGVGVSVGVDMGRPVVNRMFVVTRLLSCVTCVLSVVRLLESALL